MQGDKVTTLYILYNYDKRIIYDSKHTQIIGRCRDIIYEVYKKLELLIFRLFFNTLFYVISF